MNAIVDPLPPMPDTQALFRASSPDCGRRQVILLVDDNPGNLLILAELLEGHFDLRLARSGPAALKAVAVQPVPDLILLDLMMPGMDGYEVIEQLRATPATAEIPVILVTAHDTRAIEARALQLGAVDFVAKPVHPPVLMARIANHLELKLNRDRLARQNASLEAEVARRVHDIDLVRKASIRALASIGETRDNETGLHILRTQLYIDALGRHLQGHARFVQSLSDARLSLIVEAAPLHDIGKIGIRDEILLKPGKLTADEFTIMKTHAQLGGEALDRAIREATRHRLSPKAPDDGSTTAAVAAASAASAASAQDPLEFLKVAREIALCHHEKWDGSGYPQGLAGDAIPISARLMALADVFDALISKRVYKAAMPLDEVRRIIAEGRGRHFDPDLVDAFFAHIDDFVAIARAYADEAGSTL